MQKAMLHRQQSARQRQAMAPPPIQTVNSPRSSVTGEVINSPLIQPTPPSQRSSPSTTRSPGFMPTGASPTDLPPRQQFHQRQMQLPAFQQQQQRAHNRSMSANTLGHGYSRRSMHMSQQPQNNYYPTSFQKHYDQLGKFTSIACPIPQLLSDPGLILVQIKNMMHTSICLMMLMVTKWIRIASFPTFDFHHNREVIMVWLCKHHLLRRLQLPVMLVICLHYHSITTLCLMLIHLDSVQACISLIHLEDFNKGGRPRIDGIKLLCSIINMSAFQRRCWVSQFKSSSLSRRFAATSLGVLHCQNCISRSFVLCSDMRISHFSTDLRPSFASSATSSHIHVNSALIFPSNIIPILFETPALQPALDQSCIW